MILVETLASRGRSIMSRTFTFPPQPQLAAACRSENGQSSASMRRPSKTNLFKAFMRLNSISSRKDFLCFGRTRTRTKARDWEWEWARLRLLSQALFQRYVCRSPRGCIFIIFIFSVRCGAVLVLLRAPDPDSLVVPCTSNWHFSLSHCVRQQQRERQQNGKESKQSPDK